MLVELMQMRKHLGSHELLMGKKVYNDGVSVLHGKSSQK